MTPRNDNPSERERPSWREIDQRRDGSRHVSRGERPAARPGSPLAERLRQRALQAANKVFQGKQGTPAHQKLADALHRHFGSKKFSPLVKAYVKEYGLPRDWGLLFLFLDFPDPAISTGSLEQMARLHPARSLREQQAFLSKLRSLSALAEDPEVQEQASELLSSLS
ncbi:MAG TPA: hypothetical protein VLR91_08695 [Thermodesulfobacteriota bacterium]|nr:hypothetical protein [Thermodesulfobacteriota bacterium]